MPWVVGVQTSTYSHVHHTHTEGGPCVLRSPRRVGHGRPSTTISRGSRSRVPTSFPVSRSGPGPVSGSAGPSGARDGPSPDDSASGPVSSTSTSRRLWCSLRSPLSPVTPRPPLLCGGSGGPIVLKGYGRSGGLFFVSPNRPKGS